MIQMNTTEAVFSIKDIGSTTYFREIIPLNDLRYIIELYENITNISYFTVKTNINGVKEFLKKFTENYLEDSNNRFKFMGKGLTILNKKIL